MKALLCGPVDIINPDYGWELLTSFHTNGMHCDWVDYDVTVEPTEDNGLSEAKTIPMSVAAIAAANDFSQSTIDYTNVPYDHRGDEYTLSLSIFNVDAKHHNMHTGDISNNTLLEVLLTAIAEIIATEGVDNQLSAIEQAMNALGGSLSDLYATAVAYDQDVQCTCIAIVPQNNHIGYILFLDETSKNPHYNVKYLNDFMSFINLQNGVDTHFDVYCSYKDIMETVRGPITSLTLTNVALENDELATSCYVDQTITTASGSEYQIDKISVGSSWNKFTLYTNDVKDAYELENSYIIITRKDTNKSAQLIYANVVDSGTQYSINESFLTAEDIGKTIECTLQHVDEIVIMPTENKDYYATI